MEHDIESRLAQFEVAIQDTLDNITKCVAWIVEVTDDNLRYLLAERLTRLGTAALPGLRQVIDNAEAPSDAVYLAAWTALRLGDADPAARVLIREVQGDGKWMVPTAGALARGRGSLQDDHLSAARQAVREALMRIDPSDAIVVSNLSAALRDLGGILPEEVRAKVKANCPLWVISMIEQDFPDAMEELKECNCSHGLSDRVDDSL